MKNHKEIAVDTAIIEQRTHPDAPEQRTVDVDVQDLDTRGRTVVGYAAVYGVESGDLGGFRERIAPGAFAGVLDSDVRCLLNHDPNIVLGRTKSGTLRLADDERGLRFEVDLPESRSDLSEAVKRGDINGASFRFQVGEEDWAGDVRTVKSLKQLHDVTLATYPAYPEASVEMRTAQQEPDPQPRPSNGGGLVIRDRLRVEQRNDRGTQASIEERITEALRSVQQGEVRSLSVASDGAIAPPELSSFLFEKLRASSVALQSGIVVIPTDRSEVQWPKLTADVAPDWYAEGETITPGDPTFATLTATPHKLAHIVQASNEVIDDSEPKLLDVLNGHLAVMLGLKLDASIFEGNPAVNADSIRGLKFVAGIQTISMGTNGAVLEDYDPFIEAMGLLQAANAPGPYVAVMNPRSATELALLKTGASGSVEQLPVPSQMPQVFTTSQLSTAEAKGTATNGSSAYVYSPSQVVLVRRQDATIEVDRSRLFNDDESEIRGKLRADLLAPNPAAIVRIEGIVPA